MSNDEAIQTLRAAAYNPLTDHTKLRATLRELLDISIETTTGIINDSTKLWTKPISIPLPEGYQASYEPSGVAIQNGIELGKKLCSCDMVTLMNTGCSCGGK